MIGEWLVFEGALLVAAVVIVGVLALGHALRWWRI